MLMSIHTPLFYISPIFQNLVPTTTKIRASFLSPRIQPESTLTHIESMDGERETLEEPIEKEGSLVGDGKDLKVGVLGSDLCIEGVVCTRERDAELNGDVGFDGSKEEGKGVDPSGGEAAEALGEDSQVLRSLESKSVNEIAELDGNEATLKTLDEQKNIDDKEVNKLVEKEAISDVIQAEPDVTQSIKEHAGDLGEGSQVVRSLEGKSENETAELDGNDVTLKTLDEQKNIDIQVESDISQSIEGQAGIAEQVGSQGEQEIEGEKLDDAKQRKPTHGRVAKHVSNKSSGNILQASYQLPKEKSEFSVYDMVWGKVKSHPWWPGQIFDPSDSSVEAKKHLKKDRHLVAYFGDRTFAWNESSQLKLFRTHFSNVVKQSNSDAFQNAVDCALDEVGRCAEFGLACSCIPKDTYDEIKLQTVQNTGIREELSFTRRVDESLNASSFSPENILEYLKTLSEFPTGGFDRLELLIAKAQLLAFYRLKGYSCLPELQYCGVVDNDTDAFLIKDLIKGSDKSLSEVNKHATHASKKGQTGAGNLKTANGSCLKRKHNLKDDLYPEKKKIILSEAAGGTPDSSLGNYQPGMKDRRKTISLAKVSNTINQSFKIGERILRVANQLTGPPSSMLKCSGDRTQMEDGSADGFPGNGSDVFSPNPEKTQKSSFTVPTEYSSLDDLLHLLQWVAHEPLGDYSSLNVIVSFFSDFRNSIIVANDSGKENFPTKKVGAKRNKRPVGGSPETFEFDDLSHTHWTDMGIQSGSEKQQSQRSSRRDYQHAPAEPEKPFIVYTRRSYSRKQCSDSNHVAVPEKHSGCADENSPVELVLNFAELDSVPSEMRLNKIFRRFGPLNESETEVDRGSSRARVVFKKCVDAEVAFSSAKKFNIFGSVLVNYKLNHTPSTLSKASSLATTQDQENGNAS
ncbi:uncharacterized protein [Glycine max]|uniref:uncharacterized protein n=2 Tax=Glycine subgen. Soja TaxID=1462606 RepID=UPI001B354F50|nr:uncharacterized protein LOC100779209 [Glycine max]